MREEPQPCRIAMSHGKTKPPEKMETKKSMMAELENLNKGGLGKMITIANWSSETDSNKLPKKEHLAATIHGLYSLAKKAITAIDDSSGTEDVISKAVEMLKGELVAVLPALVKDAVDTKLADACPNQTCSKESEVVSDRHTLELTKIVTEDDDEDMTESLWTTKVKKDVSNALKKVPVIRANTSRSGSTTIEFKTKEDLDAAEKALQTNYRVNARSQPQKKLDPKVTISGIELDLLSVPNDKEKEQYTNKKLIEEEIMSKNEDIKVLTESGESMKVIFVDTKDKIAVLQVTPKIRELMKKNKDKVCLGLQRCLVKDRYHVVQCFHCQGFGHVSGSPHCKNKSGSATCFYCAGNHSSKECQHKKNRKTDKIKCCNCASSKNRNEKDACGSHKASDALCPFFIREKERMMSRTACSDDAKNEYQQRIRDLKIKHKRV